MGWRCDDLIPQMRSDELKAMARTLGAPAQYRKDDCIRFIPGALNDPARVQAAIDRLPRDERLALAVLKQFGGIMNTRGLGLAMKTLRATGQDSRPGQDDLTAQVHPLVRRGLLFYAGGAAYYGSFGYTARLVVADERILAAIAGPEVEPFSLAPAPAPTMTRARRPQAVSLDLVAALQAVNRMGGLRLTKARQRSIRSTDLTKLFKLLGWTGDRDIDGVTFPMFGDAFLNAFTGSGLLALTEDTLAPSVAAEHLAEQPYEVQAHLLLLGFLQAEEWVEWHGDRYETQVTPGQAVIARHGLLAALMALPATGDAFFKLDDLDDAWYARIGESFSLGYAVAYRPNAYGRSEKQLKSDLEKWRADLRKSWLLRERVWIRHALATWAYALGLVELGLDGPQVASARLTALGWAVLHPYVARPESLLPEAAQDLSTAGAPPAVVQPNFDILVYLDRVRPADLAFLERHAERTQMQQHTAHYRLTRDSVYRGLESGVAAEDLIDRLRRMNGGDLPQNIQVEIRQWAMARERISLRRSVELAEFANQQDRDAAIQRGIKGVPVGDRFLLLAGDGPRPRVQRHVDHAYPPVRCLSIDEDGQLLLDPAQRDTIIEAELEAWAEHKTANCWQLTQTSVSSAVRRGRRATDLVKWLDARRKSVLPAWLTVAVSAWAGEQIEAALTPAVVLRVARPDVCEAIATSATLHPHLGARVGAHTWIIRPGHEEVLREKLAWAGLEMDTTISQD